METIKAYLNEKNSQLQELNQKIEQTLNELNIAEFEEDMYYELMNGRKLLEEFKKKHDMAENKVKDLEKQKSELEEQRKIITTEIEYIEKHLDS